MTSRDSAFRRCQWIASWVMPSHLVNSGKGGRYGMPHTHERTARTAGAAPFFSRSSSVHGLATIEALRSWNGRWPSAPGDVRSAGRGHALAFQADWGMSDVAESGPLMNGHHNTSDLQGHGIRLPVASASMAFLDPKAPSKQTRSGAADQAHQLSARLPRVPARVPQTIVTFSAKSRIGRRRGRCWL